MHGSDSTSGTLQGTRSCAEVKKQLDVLVAQREAEEGSQELDQSSMTATHGRKKLGRKMSKRRYGGSTVRWRREQAKGGDEDEVRGRVVTAFADLSQRREPGCSTPCIRVEQGENLLTRPMVVELGGTFVRYLRSTIRAHAKVCVAALHASVYATASSARSTASAQQPSVASRAATVSRGSAERARALALPRSASATRTNASAARRQRPLCTSAEYRV
jgi:hypothetical protein